MPRKRNSKNVDELGRPEETMSCNRYTRTSRHAIKPKYSGQGVKKCAKKTSSKKTFLSLLQNSKFLGKNSRLLCLLYDNVSQD